MNNNRSHWVKITASTKQGPLGNRIAFLYWDNMTFEIRMKYNWYFKYRAALLQVQNPKAYVEMLWGNIEASDKTLKDILTNRVSSAKREVTKWQNIVDKIAANHSELFPVSNSYEYTKAVHKLNLKIKKFNDAIAKRDEHQNINTCQL